MKGSGVLFFACESFKLKEMMVILIQNKFEHYSYKI